MKKLIFVLFFVFLGSFSPALALIPTPVVVIQIKQVSAEIQSIDLNAIGTVNVYPQDKTKPVVTFDLSPANSDDILSKARVFINPKFLIVTDIREITCDIVEDPYSKELYAFDSEPDNYKLLLSPAGCQYSKYTHPEYAYDLQQAQELRTQLITLALQYSNN